MLIWVFVNRNYLVWPLFGPQMVQWFLPWQTSPGLWQTKKKRMPECGKRQTLRLWGQCQVTAPAPCYSGLPQVPIYQVHICI